MDNRSVILECALNLFASRGYDAVGVQEIVEAAGITKPTLYHYFGSKRGLLDSLLQEHFGLLNSQLVQAAVYRKDLLMTLRSTASAYFRFAQEQPVFYRMQLAMSFSPPQSESNQAVAKIGRQQYEIIEAMFKEAANHHGNMRSRERVYTATYIGMLNTYIALWLNESGELSDQVIYQAVQQFMYGIFS